MHNIYRTQGQARLLQRMAVSGNKYSRLSRCSKACLGEGSKKSRVDIIHLYHSGRRRNSDAKLKLQGHRTQSNLEGLESK